MIQSFTGADVSHVIQISVAPVFLLAGVGAILGVMANRLARIIDSSRTLEGRLASAEGEVYKDLHRRLEILASRAKLVTHAIAACTITALLVCAVIITLFLGAFFGTFFGISASIPAALLFISALISFSFALICFLREIFIAAASLKIGPGKPPVK